MVAEPLALPQVEDTVVDVAVTTEGCVMVTDCVITQPLASVIVQVYDPAERADAVAPDPPEGVQA